MQVIRHGAGSDQSDALHCSAFEAGQPAAQAVPACAAALGPKRNYYITLASVQDLDALRAAIGVPKLALYGISYGTYVAQAYAGLFPDRVESMVLDSAYAPSHNADTFQLKTFQALPGVLRSICARGACRGIVSNFQRRSYALLRKVAAHPLMGTWYDANGRPHHQTIGALDIAASFPDIDLRPNLRAELPRALTGALHGDTAPVARLVAGAAAGSRTATPGMSNPTLNMVALCEERDFGWDRTASPADKVAAAQAQLGSIPPAAFAPFPPAIAFAISLAPTCAYWPMLPSPPALPTGPLATIPTLVLHGEADLRTDLASAREVAARVPGAKLLTVPYVGHSVLQGDDTGCARRAVNDFYSGRGVRGCGRSANTYAPRPLAPDKRPRTPTAVVRAVRMTVADAFEQIDPGIYKLDGLRAAGGLRGGSYRVSREGLLLRRDVFQPGVAVSGVVRRHRTVKLDVTGAFDGALSFRPDGTVSGRLGRHAVHARGRLTRETVSQRLNARRTRHGQVH